MWGIIPAAGRGSRIQPLAFSKELLPVGSCEEGCPTKPRAVSDYLIERLVLGGATRLCFVISKGKSDILEYYGGAAHSAHICYSVQPHPVGLCDAIFRAAPFIDAETPVLVGLPDTIWFPAEALSALPDDAFSLLLFPVDQPQHFDAVLLRSDNTVQEIQVKSPQPASHWIWGAFKMPGSTFQRIRRFWEERNRVDEYFGTLVNAWIARGETVYGVSAGTSYLDVGTIDGFLQTIRTLHPDTTARGAR